METLSTQPIVFKIAFGDEIRRVTVDPKEVTFDQLYHASVQGLTPSNSRASLQLTWKDQENDSIVLKTQIDLNECLKFMSQSNLTTMKIFVEEVSAISHDSAVPPSYHGLAQRDEDDDDDLIDDKDEENFDDKLFKMEEDIKSFLGNGKTVSPRLRKKLEKMNEKFARKERKANEKLSKLRNSPHFDEKSYLAQLQLLADAGIPTSTAFVQFHVMKKHIKKNRRANCGCAWMKRSFCGRRSSSISHDGEETTKKCCISRCGSRRGKRWMGNASEKTKVQLKVLEEQGLPHNFWIAKMLEAHNSPLDPKSEIDAAVIEQLKGLNDLSSIPQPILIQILRVANLGRIASNMFCCKSGF